MGSKASKVSEETYEDLKRRSAEGRVSIKVVDRMARERGDLDDRGEPVGVRHPLIGSIARIENRPVLTRNRRGFGRIEGLELLE